MRDLRQSIKEPLQKLLDGINEFDKAVDERIKSKEWNRNHIDILDEMRNKLITYKKITMELIEENW